MSAQAAQLPWAHRPLVGSGDWSSLTEWPLLASVQVDRVIGRDILQDPQQWSTRLDWLIERLQGRGRITLSERHPHQAQRLSALPWRGTRSAATSEIRPLEPYGSGGRRAARRLCSRPAVG